MGRYEEALVDLNRAIELKPDYEWIARRGVTYRLMERYGEALADLTRAIELKPDYDWAITQKENLLSSQQFAEGKYYLSTGITEKHRTPYNQGLNYQKLNQPALAQSNFQKAIQRVRQELRHWTIRVGRFLERLFRKGSK